MKFKDNYYTQNGLVNPKYTKNDWLRYDKDRYYKWATSVKFQRAFGIELKPKHSHRRSFAIRDLKWLYGSSLADLAWVERFYDEMGSDHGITCEQPKKHRLYVYSY